MTVNFHPPEDEPAYADKLLAILLQAALPEAKKQLDRLLQAEALREAGGSA